MSSDIGLGHIAVELADMRARGVPADAKLQLLIDTVSTTVQLGALTVQYENGTYSCEFLQTVSGLRPVDSSLGSLSHEAVCTLCVWLCDGLRLAKCCRAAVARNACTTAALHLRRTHRRRCAGYRLPEDAQDGIGTCPTVPGHAMARRGAGETPRGKGGFFRTHAQTYEKV